MTGSLLTNARNASWLHTALPRNSACLNAPYYWISQDLIRAVPIGKQKYKVDLRLVETFLRLRAQQHDVI